MALLCGLGAVVFLLFVWGFSAIEPPRSVPYASTPIGERAAEMRALRTVQPKTNGYKPKHTPFIPLELGRVVVDLQPTLNGTVHAAMGGPSGLGKSTAVLPLFDIPIGVLCVALDNTRPIKAKVESLADGISWTNDPDECSVGLDFLSGKASIVSEGLIAGMPKGQTEIGTWRRAARQRIWDTLEALDAASKPRNYPDIIQGLLARSNPPDPDADRACRDWAKKLQGMHRIFGHTLGTDLDLVQAMRRRQKVLLRVNRFISPDDAPLIGGMLMVLSRRVAQEAGIPFILIIEEAGQADVFQAHISPIAQAARDRGVCGVWLTQNLNKLPDEVKNNTAVWVTFAQEDAAEQRFAAHKLRIEPELLYRESFPGKGEAQGRGWAYVRAPGVPTTLVYIRKQTPWPAVSPRVSGVTHRPVAPDFPLSTPLTSPLSSSLPVVEDDSDPEPIPEPLSLEKPMQRMWEQCRRTGTKAILWSPERGVWYDERGCLEWQGTMTTDEEHPRPRANIGKRVVTPYIEIYRRVKGSPEPTLDHLCDNRICEDWTHLEAVSIAENNARRTARTTAFGAEGWTAAMNRKRVVERRSRVAA